MASHEELISEMPVLEKMTIQERLKHAKKRRNQQLKRYQQYERDVQRRTKKLSSQKSGGDNNYANDGNKLVIFAANVQLLEAAARGDTEEVEAFLKSGVDPNTGNEDGLTALHQSCIDNREDMLKILLDNGADVNIKDRELWTPLHAASTCGHKDLAAHLISRKADLLAINSDGNMPYDICEDEETLDYIESQMATQGISQDQIDDLREVAPNLMLKDMKKLVEDGGDLEYHDATGATPLHVAVSQGYEKVVVYLLDSKVDIHARDGDGWQPIHAAACWAQAEIIQILVEHGADLDSRTTNNETPLMICEEDDIKSLIHQLKTESLKNQRHNLVRRSSSRKHRGSSIRRSSKRDKGEMGKMDARGEAAFIQSQDLPATNIDDVIANGPSENGPSEGQSEEKSEQDGQADDQPPSLESNEPATPDVIMTDETLPESRLSILEAEKATERDSEETPSESIGDVNENDDDANNHTDGLEIKRPKSILKKTTSRIDTEPEVMKKIKKDDRKSDKKTELDRSLSQEQKFKDKEEKEKERMRVKEEKEKKKLKEKEEKQRRKEELAEKKQKEKEEKLKKEQPESVEVEMMKSDEEIDIGLDEENHATTENNGAGSGETLPEVKRNRSLKNSPMHSNHDSVDISASSDNSPDTPATEKQNGGASPGGAKPPKVANSTISSRLSAKFPFSLPFMQSYNLHDSSTNYNQQKKDSVALSGPEDMQDVLPPESGNRTSVNLDSEEGNTLKTYSDTQGFQEEETTETCCKVM